MFSDCIILIDEIINIALNTVTNMCQAVIGYIIYIRDNNIKYIIHPVTGLLPNLI
jgi:small nuclear ribonucleoprotein (snRNP)-like protein